MRSSDSTEENNPERTDNSMRELKIADIKSLENGEYIPSFCGTIEKVYEQKHGEGDYGAWSLQNMIVQDESGKVQVTWGGEDDMKELEGQTRIFESSQTKHGLRGCRWEVKTKNGTRYESVKLTDTCKIKPVNGGDATCQQGQEQPKTSTQIGNAAPSVPSAGAASGIYEARQHIMQASNLYVLCIRAVNTYIAKHLPEIAQTSEQFQATLASIWIEASSRRSTDGIHWWSYIDKMEARPVHNGNEKVERPPSYQENIADDERECDQPPF